VGVAGVACGVGVAREVQPRHGEVLGMPLGCEHRVDPALVGIGRGVGDEGIDLLRCRLQPGERERDATEEGRSVCLRRGTQPCLLDASEHVTVERVAHPARVLNHRGGWHGWWHESPVRLVNRAFGHPATQHLALRGRQWSFELGRWHHFLGVGLVDALYQGTGGQVAWHDGPHTALELGTRSLRCVEA
jgi:hypothetical protein